ncbi:MAG TPA: RecQ family ATP-dependent DNA helicase, partial [Parasegetibacter sp.]
MIRGTEHITYPVTFIDAEIDPDNGKILDLGGVRENGSSFHKSSLSEFVEFAKGANFICGHNILRHDLKYLGNALKEAGIDIENAIDTLFLSPLLFPGKEYHSLLKDDKIQPEDLNNPLTDAKKAKNLFYSEVAAFEQLNLVLKQIFYLLLNQTKEFKPFFHYLEYAGYAGATTDPIPLIEQIFKNEICRNAPLQKFVTEKPIELAYSLSIIFSYIQDPATNFCTPRWIVKNFPEVERTMFQLRNKPCLPGCEYCNSALDARKGLKAFFGYDGFRTFGDNHEPLQENAVNAALNSKSLLAIFPTGGGKSITFQLPALMFGKTSRSLTVVISPLQSLMKDQVDNLEKKGITEAVTINGLLDPIERAKSFERVEDGSASILYISPESLRSKSIERLILGRKIARFVIDEAHCFSSWGQDFRVDYMYIGDFIKQIQEKKNLSEGIPVSCFTATARPQVIEDICTYFREKLSINLELFTSKASRTNLHYEVRAKTDDNDKYQELRNLIEARNCPTIIYVSRTKKAIELAEKLTTDGFNAKPYHGKMDISEKTANQNAFISGEVSIMVATSAFGMGVDKSDVGLVIHYEISDSLENYVQEAGRAGRDEKLRADCFVLFNEDDLSKHFVLLNQSKLSINEIKQVWKAIKDITRFRTTVSNSALEIARIAGWDDGVRDIETRVTTAIAALEDAGYLKRGQNMPRIFANSILAKNVAEAVGKINASSRFTAEEKGNAIRIIRKLISSKSRQRLNEEAGESRIDYLSDHLGIRKEEVIEIVNLLREEGILADSKDLTAFIRRGEQKNRSLHILESYSRIENHLHTYFDQEAKVFHIKELNEDIGKKGVSDVTTNKIKTIINFWTIKKWIERKSIDSKNHLAIRCCESKDILSEKLQKRQAIAKHIIELLYERSLNDSTHANQDREEVLVEFSVHELKKSYEASQGFFKDNTTVEDVEDALFYLSRIEAIKIEGGFLVLYNRLTIERIESNNKKQYTNDDYQKLDQFYKNKIQQIHIVGEYANMMLNDYKAALRFVEDYFQLNYPAFLNKYFKGNRQKEIKRNITPAKFRQLFGELSPTQLKIINDQEANHIVVAAGPGSGKTRLLVHKLASILFMEDVKHEQLLMLTFSRAAATEFKKRLIELIGKSAGYVEIKTFHSYCFDLLGKIGNVDNSEEVIRSAVAAIRNKEVETSRITKTVLVIDEAQDMSS